MIANPLFAAVAVGAFLLLCVVSWYVVAALRQLRLTALAMEQFFTCTRPRVEAAADKLGSLIGRTDRFLASVEENRGGAATALGLIGQTLSGWSAGSQAVSTISAVIAAVAQAWSMLARPKGAPENPATAGGSEHE